MRGPNEAQLLVESNGLGIPQWRQRPNPGTSAPHGAIAKFDIEARPDALAAARGVDYVEVDVREIRLALAHEAKQESAEFPVELGPNAGGAQLVEEEPVHHQSDLAAHLLVRDGAGSREVVRADAPQAQIAHAVSDTARSVARAPR